MNVFCVSLISRGERLVPTGFWNKVEPEFKSPTYLTHPCVHIFIRNLIFLYEFNFNLLNFHTFPGVLVLPLSAMYEVNMMKFVFLLHWKVSNLILELWRQQIIHPIECIESLLKLLFYATNSVWHSLLFSKTPVSQKL